MKFLKSKIGKKICPFSQCTNVRRIGMKRSALRKEIDSFVLIGKRDAIFAQKGSARLINLCEMPKLQRKHTFLRLTIYIGAHFYKQNGRAWLHSTNPPRLVHLIWGWPYRRYSRLRICVGKKKKNWTTDVAPAPPIFVRYLSTGLYLFFMQWNAPIPMAARPRAPALHCTTLTKIRNYSAPEKGIFAPFI